MSMCECMCMSVHHVCMHVVIGEGLGSWLSPQLYYAGMDHGAILCIRSRTSESRNRYKMYGQAISLLFIPKVSGMSEESVEWGNGRALV